ncbi:hypothetical protein A2U01_0006323 [Trifolium medium]|uniref:Uncharacterized protein n=1 Tax=Trifolium medium TaxID=97028 RepID=A0A392MD78_9FABA|nr:hypothetical protein [Trifolium medium]
MRRKSKLIINNAINMAELLNKRIRQTGPKSIKLMRLLCSSL